MFKSVVENKKAIVLFSSTEIGKKHSFSSDDWDLAKCVVELLRPAYTATNDVSGAYVTGSMVIPLTKVLLNWYNDKKTTYPDAWTVSDVTEENFRARDN